MMSHIDLILKALKLVTLASLLSIAFSSTSYSTSSAGMINTIDTQVGGTAGIGTNVTTTYGQLGQTPQFITEYHLVKPGDLPLCAGTTCTTAQYEAQYGSCTNGGFVVAGSTTSIAYQGANYYTYVCQIPAMAWYNTSSAEYASLQSELQGQIAWTNPNGSIPELLTTIAADNTLPTILTTFITNECDPITINSYNNSAPHNNTAAESYSFAWGNVSLSTGVTGEVQTATTSGTINCNATVKTVADVYANENITITKTFNTGTPEGYNDTSCSAGASCGWNVFPATGHQLTIESGVYPSGSSSTPGSCSGSYTVKASDVGNTVYIACCKRIYQYISGSPSTLATATGTQSTAFTNWTPCQKAFPGGNYPPSSP